MIDLPVEAVPTNTGRGVPSDTPVTTAAQHLRDPTVSALVVLEEGTVAGVVTGSDVVAFVAETGESVTVDAIMSTPATTASPTDSIREAATTMREAGVRHLPVVDGDAYCGVLSASTIAPYLSGRSLEIVWDDEPIRLETSPTTGVTARK